MHVLVAHATKMGGTAGIAEKIAEVLQAEKLTVTLRPAAAVEHAEDFDAVVLGSALYALRWRRPAVRLLKRLSNAGFDGPVWLFHSGPLGDEESGQPQAFPSKVEILAEPLDVRGTATFGGRLPTDARGFIASSMVKQGRSGDWRDMEEVRIWAKEIAVGLGEER